MCIVILSTAHSRYPFILLSNRDEFLSRPTAPADWWDPPNEHVLGGRDLQRKERGTWLAITKQGRIAALTNFREDGDTHKTMDKSRGAMVNAFLTGDLGEDPHVFAKRLIEDVGVKDVGGFSLLFDLVTIATDPGETRGLSNSHFGDNSWPKVVLGERLLQEAIANDVDNAAGQPQFIEALFNILSVDKLPKRREDEAWDEYVYHMRKSILIPPAGVETGSADKVATAQPDQSGNDSSDHSKVEVRPVAGGYGTQKQTVILVDQRGQVKFVERTLYNEHGVPTPKGERDREFEFEIEGWRSLG